MPRDHTVRSILELGCGTGNLSLLLSQAFPDAEIRLVDVSQESIDVCRSRIGSRAQFQFETIDFRELRCAASEFDLLVSSIAIHHVPAIDKQTLLSRAFEWLADGGVLAYADQFAAAAEDVYRQHLLHWKRLTFQAGASAEEWGMWMSHQSEHDHHDTLADQMLWMKRAGFAVVDCPWRYLLWSVLQGRKISGRTGVSDG